MLCRENYKSNLRGSTASVRPRTWAIRTTLALVLMTGFGYVNLTDSSVVYAQAQIPEYDIVIGRTIDVPSPAGLVYRDDGFWVLSYVDGGLYAKLLHYSFDGEFLEALEAPGIRDYAPSGLAWDGTHWWATNPVHDTDYIYEFTYDPDGNLEVLRRCAWPGPGSGAVGIEFAQGYLWVSENHTDKIYRVALDGSCFGAVQPWATCPQWGWEPFGLAFDGTDMWSLSGPSGSKMGCLTGQNTCGLREIYKHDADGNIIEIWRYPPADDPGVGSYGGYGTGIAFADGQLYYCDFDKGQIIEAIMITGEPDSDGDGVPDDEDAFPNDPTRWEDVPPTVEGPVMDPQVLWPPNHKMVDITVMAVVTDEESGVDPASVTLSVDDEYDDLDGAVAMDPLGGDIYVVSVADKLGVEKRGRIGFSVKV